MMDIPDDYNNRSLVYVLILSRNITGGDTKCLISCNCVYIEQNYLSYSNFIIGYRCGFKALNELI